MIIVLILVIFVAVLLALYVNLQYRRRAVEELQLRLDLLMSHKSDKIAGMASLAEGCLHQNKDLLAAIRSLRMEWDTRHEVNDEAVHADAKLYNLAGEMTALAENVPGLSQDLRFTHLRDTWRSIEKEISDTLRAYNSAVAEYNGLVSAFPSSLLAGALRIAPGKFLNIPLNRRHGRQRAAVPA